MQYEFDFIPHFYGDNLIHQRSIDGFVNATAMCKAVGKQFSDYSRVTTHQDFLNELSAVRGIPRTDLVITIRGGTPDLQGTWVHPDVAIHLGQWCSPRFAVLVAQWVNEWLSGKASKAPMPYHLDRYLANADSVPHGYFSILTEMTLSVIAKMERAGYTLPDHMVPDIAGGQYFCRYLRSKGIDTSAFPTYQHKYDDGRVVPAKLYPIEHIGEFRRFIYEVWLPTKAFDYFKKRDPKALPFIPKALPPRSDEEAA